MKTKWCILVFLMAATVARAQTNLTALLQQGLFEEQANRNLEAAISNYQSLATQFDQNRQLAATAIFRLGECYRMENKTNEATAEYQRILNEFSDQTTLVTLSRQNLTGMGVITQPQFRERLQNIITKTPEEQIQAIEAIRTATSTDDEDQEIRRIQTMIQNSPDLINARNSEGSTPLENAARNGWLKVAAYLLEHGADVSADDGSALLDATGVGNRAMVEFLLSRGVDINSKDSQGNTSLHLAAGKNFQAVAEALLANKADVNAESKNNWTPLMSAASGGHLEIVKMFLAAGANVNLKDTQGRTALNCAIGNSPEIMQTLLNAGADPNTEDNQGRTPLSYASERDSSAVVKMLLVAKAEPNGGKPLNSPLLCAIYRKNIASTELLLEAGANPNAVGGVSDFSRKNPTAYFMNNQWHLTPLWLAIYLDDPSMVQLLLKYKANPNDSQTGGTPVLFDALDDTNILAALLNAGGNANSHPSNCLPLLSDAVCRTNITAVQLLLEHGADVNVRNDDDQNGFGNYTPLHFAAAQLADPKIFELLFEYHADPNVRGDDGRTPLDLLKEKMGRASTANVRGNVIPMRTFDNPSDEEKTEAQAAQLADLLRKHGALDNLPDWNSIKISRPSANFSETIFRKGTNDWNHFTLLELICNSSDHYDFPDFARIAVVRPNLDGKTSKRIEINLLNSTNGMDCSKDMTLQFGDTVEIPERPHTLAEKDDWTKEQIVKIISCLRDKAGEVKLIVDGGQTIQLPLKYFEPVDCHLGRVLGGPAAQNVLTSDSDLSRVKVTRRDSKTGKKSEWILDCSADQTPAPANSFAARIQRMTQNASQASPDLWLRAGDVIEVPEK